MKTVMLYTHEKDCDPVVFDISNKELAAKAWLALFKIMDNNQEFIELKYPQGDDSQLNFSFAYGRKDREKMMYDAASKGDSIAIYHLIKSRHYQTDGKIKIVQIQSL